MPKERLSQGAKGGAAVNLSVGSVATVLESCTVSAPQVRSLSADAARVSLSTKREGEAGDSVIGEQDGDSTIVGRLFAGGRDAVYPASKVRVVVRLFCFELLRRGDDNVVDVVNMDSTRRVGKIAVRVVEPFSRGSSGRSPAM